MRTIVNAIVAVAISVLLSGCLTTHGSLERVTPLTAATPPGAPIGWEIVNRDRLIFGSAEEDRFHHYLAAYIDEYGAWFRNEPNSKWRANVLDSDLLHTARRPFRFRPDAERLPGDNITVRYDTTTTSYRCGETRESRTKELICRTASGTRNWMENPERLVRVTLVGATAQSCEWTWSTHSRTGPCAGALINAPVGKDMDVFARPLGSSAEPAKGVIHVNDLTIVALGDSFSAGEGNPHSQWRVFTFRPRPAIWLDPRCHRSLMSGASLAAAFIAEHNRHTSVTLLHYGCSGASIADGLATPWAHLETSESVDKRWQTYQTFFHIRRTPDQITAALNPGLKARPRPNPGPIDYPPTQIEQALSDLGPGAAPDVVLVTIGGNDLGFADLVQALSLHAYTPELSPNAVTGLDKRPPVQTFDQDMWVNRRLLDQPCDPTKRAIDCLRQRVLTRIDTPATPDQLSATGTLTAQYAALAKALAPLTAGQGGRVFITHYPNFVVRWKKEDGHTDLPAPGDGTDELQGCDDRPLDGRAGLVPALAVWLGAVPGVQEADARDVGDRILTPLNNAVDAAALKNGWTVVDRHIKNGMLHGYCSFTRYYNTYADSLWLQGHKPTTLRPLGNFVLEVDPAIPLHAANGDVVGKGARLVFVSRQGCFVVDGSTSGCVRDANGFDPVVYDQGRKLDKKRAVVLSGEKASDNFLSTTGPVHPNLFGQCNQAGAVVTSIALSDRYSDKLDVSWVNGVREKPHGLTALDLCKPEAWGYQATPRR